MRSSSSTAFLFALGSLAVACSVASPNDGTSGSSSALQHVDGGDPSGPKLCAALRGNGEDIYAHFVSLARMIESVGLFDGMAGGSSSTITMFTYESILKHPALRDCGDASGPRTCADAEVAARASLLLKSVRGYAEEVGISDGILGNAGIVELVSQIQSQGVESLIDTDPASAATELQTLLAPATLARVGILVNPELLDMLAVTDPTLLAYNAREVVASVKEVGAWTITDNRLFFRPGLVDFDAAAGSTFARLGDFYAGYGPSDVAAMKTFLDACAPSGKGLLWVDPNGGSDIRGVTESTPGITTEVIGVTAPAGTTCGADFSAQVSAYLAAADLEPQNSRIDETIGDTLHALAATSVVTGNGIEQYATARALYQSGQYATGDIPFGLSFDEVKFGYWGSEASLSTVLANPMGYTDEKTQKAISLGASTWREILSRSPAEPGLARLRDLPDGSLAAGGWPDLAPVLALKNLGCDRVVYVTRQDAESDFAIGVAKKLGMTSTDNTALYDLSSPSSGFTSSLREATGVWCTNWNAFTDSQMDALAADSYSSPLQTSDPFFSAYSDVVASANKVGCTAGVAQ
jgi:hypothetical protein